MPRGRSPPAFFLSLDNGVLHHQPDRGVPMSAWLSRTQSDSAGLLPTRPSIEATTCCLTDLGNALLLGTRSSTASRPFAPFLITRFASVLVSPWRAPLSGRVSPSRRRRHQRATSLRGKIRWGLCMVFPFRDSSPGIPQRLDSASSNSVQFSLRYVWTVKIGVGKFVQYTVVGSN